MRGSDVMLQLFQYISPLAVGVFAWVAGKLSQLIAARVKNEYLRGVFMRLDDTVVSVVREIHQVTVAAIKANSVDGKIPAGARETIRNAALTAIKAHLGTKGLADVTRVLGLNGDGLERLLGTKVEAAVHDLKTQQRLVGGVSGAGGAQGGARPLTG